MATKPTQNTRIGSFSTPLGTDKLVLARFDGSEGISELFDFRIEAYGTDENIDFDQALGLNCCVSLKNYGGTIRHFNGVLVEAKWRGVQDKFQTYSMILRPWFWMLSRVANCRIFSEKNIPDIISDVLGKYGFAKFRKELSADYPVLEYCVQYRETDLNFCCRLMEEAGIYYFFEHTASEHTMVLADSRSAHHPKLGGAKLVFRQLAGQMRRKQEHLFVWHPERRFSSGRVVLNDYYYLTPSASLVSEKQSDASYPNSTLELYDYPGRFEDKSLGQNYARIRLEAEQAADRRCQAAGDAVSCCPGGLMELDEHPNPAQNREYLIVRASHSFVSDHYRTTTVAATEEIYSGNYEFLPSEIPYRSPQLTPKSMVHGPQTAKVAGEGEIDVDEHGRIMVHFYWDRDQVNSRRVRIAQVWSGVNWGGIIIPRVGMEVVVIFLEGDPDYPLVTGTVYNADNPVPYTLPKEKTQAGIKSNSSEGGNGFNEFVFDDKQGSELIRMHAQKDLEGVIENDESRHVKRDVSIKIDHDRTEKIGNNLTQDVGMVKTVTAGQKIELKVQTSKIVIEPSGITIQSPTITIKADATIDVNSPLTTVKGTAILTLKGGLVLIN